MFKKSDDLPRVEVNSFAVHDVWVTRMCEAFDHDNSTIYQQMVHNSYVTFVQNCNTDRMTLDATLMAVFT